MSSRRRLLPLVAALLTLAAVTGGAWLARHRVTTLPRAIVIEDLVRDLSRQLDRESVVVEPPDSPARAGDLRPGDRLAGHGERPSLIAPAATRLRFALDVPAGTVLRFGVGVQGEGKRNPDASGVRFSVSADGRELWTQTVNPSATRHDRRWFDQRLDLGAYAGRRVELGLATELAKPGHPPAGTPGWGTVRLVRVTTHDRQPAAPDRPNLLVILVDTLRADQLGCYGATPSPSPNLDRFAADGLVFTQAIAQASWTLPSVSSLFSGLHPRSHGATGKETEGDFDAAWGFLADDVVTWAEVASRAGITTVGVSANPLVSRGTNLAQGFESFVELPWDPEHRRWGTAAEVNQAFLDWLAHNGGHRFAAYLHYMEPHDPYTPAKGAWPELPPGMRADLASGWVLSMSEQLKRGGVPLLPPEQVAYLRALYQGEIRTWDAELPALLDGLDRLGRRASTVIVVTADHGEEFQEHGLLLHRSHLYDELLRVPLVIAGPGIAPGRRTDQVQGIDLFPTVGALLGFETPAELAGQSLLAPVRARAALVETNGLASDHTRADLVAVRTPAWKLIDLPERSTTELYDLAHDPGEQTTLPTGTGEGPALRAALDDFARRASAPPARDGYDPALREKLRALGYTN